MRAKNLGLKDIPIARADEEALGLTNYAEVLGDFVARCDTPITVALQGDWGSGKTSLMNLIRESLDRDERYRTVWFNTWQYAQFNSSNTLALSMMSYFVNSLAPSDGNVARAAAKSVLNLTRALAVGGASVIGQADTVKTFITEAQEGSGDVDPSRALTDLKERITKVVKQTIEGSRVERVVVFIDDIDRLVPAKAIELLEALKIFLDIDRCVYIIACDYSVVVTGLKGKFGVDEDALQGKSFFDKIIQVPFKMPIGRYRVEKYLKSLLEKINVEAEENDIDVYEDLIEFSIGFNPRTMKRMFNSLVLLTILAKKEMPHSQGESARSRVLFGVLCMQEHYEHLYDFIRRQPLNDELFKDLIGQFDNADKFQELREKMSVGKDTDPCRVKSFMKAFFRCLQLKDGDDEVLSFLEAKHLKDVLSLSAIVSASVEEYDVNADEFVFNLRRELNEHYRDHLNKQRPRIGKFRYSRSEDEVFLELPAKIGWCRFTVQIEGGHWGFGLEAERTDGSLSRVERHFRDKLRSIEKVALERDRYFAWYWQPADPSAEEDLRKSLYVVLDEMLPRLYELCKGFSEDEDG